MHARIKRRRSCQSITGQFWTKALCRGKYFSFQIGSCFTLHRVTVVDPKSSLTSFEIRGHAIGITRIVVVRVAVRVHIAEVVTVVVIRRPLPPIGRRTLMGKLKHPTDRFYRNTPINLLTILICHFLGR